MIDQETEMAVIKSSEDLEQLASAVCAFATQHAPKDTGHIQRAMIEWVETHYTKQGHSTLTHQRQPGR